jgi:scyllo-inositol 2-dehydrogenase (NADP+)
MEKCTVGIIGFGPKSASHTFHVPLIGVEPRLRLKTVSTLLPDESRPLLPDTVNVVTEADDILHDPEIDLVVVATPNAWHYEYAKRAIEQGKHVIVEKPIAITSAEVDELIALADTRKVLLSQFHNRRWDGGFLTTKKLMGENRCGNIASFEMNYDRWAPDVPDNWREAAKPGSGALYDLGVHLIDQTFALFGRPQSVYATIKTQRTNAQTDDYFKLHLDYGHIQATLGATMLAAAPGPRYKLYGDKGSYTKYGIDLQAVMLNDGKLPGQPGWGEDTPESYGRFNDGAHEETLPTELGSYQSFYASIAASILENTPPPVPVADARDILALIEAAVRSNTEGRRIEAAEIGFLISPSDTVKT